MSGLPFKVRAIFEYTSPHEDDLHFQDGQIITVTEDDEEDWYTGEYVDASGARQEGIFPRNFVEKYEPTAPPRPARSSRPKRDPEPAVTTEMNIEPSIKTEFQEQGHGETYEPATVIGSAQLAPSSANLTYLAMTQPTEVAPKLPSKPATPAKPSGPPPVSEKPTGGSFRDRIAAFNKPAAPPVTPFKPGGFGPGGSSFVKKPFVAPPPSKDSYVPIPRESTPQKIYRRDEDPEIVAREAENLENAERAGLAPTNERDGEDLPKPTSLKERIALLQKQQMEQAARHAEAAQKKEKPKRPTKKRTESLNVGEEQDEGEGTVLEKQESHDIAGKKSIDSAREEFLMSRGMPRRKSSKGPPTHPGFPRESFDDGNDADMSGAGNETEEPEEISTGRDDSDDKPRKRPVASQHRVPAPPLHEPSVEEVASEEQQERDEEAEEEDIDPEIRRKEELRARMAKMSGGMGMHGMFGPPGGMPLPAQGLPKKKKSSASGEKAQPNEYHADSASLPSMRAPPVPGIPLPGMIRARSPEEMNRNLEAEQEAEQEDEPQQGLITSTRQSHEIPDVEDAKPARAMPQRSPPLQGSGYDSLYTPQVPGERPMPPPIPSDSRPSLPPLTKSPSVGSESDDEMSMHASQSQINTPSGEVLERVLPSRPSGAPSLPLRPGEGPSSPRSPAAKRTSYFGTEAPPTSPSVPGTGSKRASRVPPIPGPITALPASQTRPPPPPTPSIPLSRSSTGDQVPSPKRLDQEGTDEEVTEYEGDYDTDIASAVPHKDALKSHARDSSVDDTGSFKTPLMSPPGAPPPLPLVSAPRTAPPPLPSQPPPNRQSLDMPRPAPAPPLPPKEIIYDEDNDEYDPNRYTASRAGRPMGGMTAPSVERDENAYPIPSPRTQIPPHERAAPPPLASPSLNRAPVRQSFDVQRTQATGRRSTDLSRMSLDSGFLANDADLAEGTIWWATPNSTPPVFQNRRDILYETEETTSTKRGGRSTTIKELYILFHDYSQTIITVRYDPQNPSEANLEQRHEPPPPRPRQDQLEESHERFGRRIVESVGWKKDTAVRDGTPQALITELMQPFPDALLPVGTRAYGALVYSNLANASTSQYDEIRPGDIITFRNARFQGKHGPMHAKYSMEVGTSNTGGHVAIVSEWDGTKKKVRAWEQGREKKKVALESFKLDDLRSGEVKIWRVMPRGWVGWEGQN